MGTYYCEGCERNRQSDEKDFLVWNDLWYCEDCFGPLQWAQYHYENEEYENPYKEDDDPLSDYAQYEEHHQFLSMKDPLSDVRVTIDNFFKGAA